MTFCTSCRFTTRTQDHFRPILSWISAAASSSLSPHQRLRSPGEHLDLVSIHDLQIFLIGLQQCRVPGTVSQLGQCETISGISNVMCVNTRNRPNPIHGTQWAWIAVRSPKIPPTPLRIAPWCRYSPSSAYPIIQNKKNLSAFHPIASYCTFSS